MNKKKRIRTREKRKETEKKTTETETEIGCQSPRDRLQKVEQNKFNIVDFPSNIQFPLNESNQLKMW